MLVSYTEFFRNLENFSTLINLIRLINRRKCFYSAIVKMIPYITLLLSIILIEMDSYGQVDFPLQFDSYTANTPGIENNHVLSITQDDKGYMWFGTERGLSRFDGSTWKSFLKRDHPALPSDEITSLTTSQSKVWIGTESGLGYLTYTDLYKNVHSVDLPGGQNYIINSIISSVDSSVWLGTNKGLLLIKSDSIPFFIFNLFDSLNINSLILFREHLYIGHTKGLSRFSLTDTSIQQIYFGENKGEFPSPRVETLYGDKYRNEVWVGTKEGILYLLSGHNGEVLRKIDLSVEISSIELGAEEKVWVGTQEGIFEFRKTQLENGEKSDLSMLNSSPRERRGLLHEHTNCIFRGNEDIIWIGTLAGINKFDPSKEIFQSYWLPKGEIEFANINSIVENDRRSIYIGLEDKGLISLDPVTGNISQPHFALGLRENIEEQNRGPIIRESTVSALEIDAKGKLWMAVNGIDDSDYNDPPVAAIYSHERGNSISRQEIRMKGTRITSLKAVGDGNFFLLGTQSKGLYTFSTNEGIEIHKTLTKIPFLDIDNPPKKPDNNFTINLIEKDYLDPMKYWIGTETEGLLYYDNSLRRIVRPQLSFPFSGITCFYQRTDNNDIWIGTREGALYKFYYKENGELEGETTENSIYFIRTSGKMMLPQYPIHKIYGDFFSNSLWIIYDRGIGRYDLEREVITEFFDSRFGGISKDLLSIKEGCGTQNNSGVIYFGGQGGVIRMDPRKAIVNPSHKAELILTGVEKMKDSYWNIFHGNTFSPLMAELPLQYGEKVAIKFTVVDFLHSDSYQYVAKVINSRGKQIYMDSLDSQTRLDLILPKRFFIFGPYYYQLNIQGVGPKSEHIKNEIILNIKAIPPIFLSFWFLIIAIPLFCFLLFYLGLHLYQKRQERISKKLLERNAELEVQVSIRTEELQEKTNQLEESTSQLRNRTEELIQLHNRINSISRLETTQEISVSAMYDLLNYFGFDFISIAEIDYVKGKVELKYTDTKDENIVDPNSWLERTIYPLESKDIIASVIRSRKVYHLEGNQYRIEGNEKLVEVPLNEGEFLNWNVYHKFGHKDLYRIYFPFVKREREKTEKHNVSGHSSSEGGDYPLGVFEAGFFKSNRREITPQELIDIKLYIDNCAQVFYRAFQREEDERIEDLIKEANRLEDPQKYLGFLLEKIVESVDGTHCGNIMFSPLNRVEGWRPKVSVTKYMDSEEFYDAFEKNWNLKKEERKKGIYDFVVDSMKYYFTGNVNDDPFYIPGNSQIKSQLSNPILYGNKVLGVVNSYSNELDCYDEKKAQFIDKMTKKFSEPYYKKKTNHFLEKLEGLNLSKEDNNNVYSSVLQIVEDYFHTNLVSIWEVKKVKSHVDSRNSAIAIYEPVISSELLTQALEEYEIYSMAFSINETFNADNRINREEILNDFDSLSDLVKGFSLESMLMVPFAHLGQNDGFIIIFSLEENLQLLPEEKIFLNQVASKVISSNQLIKLKNAFLDIPKYAIEKGIEEVLKQVTGYAVDILHADPVVLYQYDRNTEQIDKVASYSGNFTYSDGINLGNDSPFSLRTHLAYRVLEKGTQYVKSKEDFKVYFGSRVEFEGDLEQDFWDRESIKSLAALRLVTKDGPIGVMFFNYRVPNDFSNETKELIEAFAAQATQAIVNSQNVSIIQNNNIQLKELKDQLVKKNEELEEVNAKLDRDLYDLLPSASAISFVKIMYGVSHDLINFLVRMKQAIIEIRKNSTHLFNKEQLLVEKRSLDIEKSIFQVGTLLEAFDFDNLNDLENIQKEIVEINTIIRRTIDFLKLDQNENIFFDILKLSNENPELYGVPIFLSMIFYNLLNNAVEAIKIKNRTNGIVKVSTGISKESIWVEIEDNGCGIPNNLIDRIFEYKVTTKKNGKGIGLHFVKRTVEEEFNGKIEVDSKVGEWTKFRIEFPNI